MKNNIFNFILFVLLTSNSYGAPDSTYPQTCGTENNPISIESRVKDCEAKYGNRVHVKNVLFESGDDAGPWTLVSVIKAGKNGGDVLVYKSDSSGYIHTYPEFPKFNPDHKIENALAEITRIYHQELNKVRGQLDTCKANNKRVGAKPKNSAQ